MKDRLSSFFYWQDKQSLIQACNICLEQEIDFSELEKWALKELQEDKFQVFVSLLDKMKNSSNLIEGV